MNKRCFDQQNLLSFAGLFFLVMVVSFLIFVFLNVFYAKHPVIVVNFDDKACLIEDSFELMWLHSVEKQWWIERYQADADGLLLTDAYLQTFGAGTPSTEAVVSNNSRDHPGYIHYRINTHLPHLNWMISHNIKASLITKDGTLPIYTWVSDYTNIYIAPKQLSLWTQLFQESCYEHDHTTQ